MQIKKTITHKEVTMAYKANLVGRIYDQHIVWLAVKTKRNFELQKLKVNENL